VGGMVVKKKLLLGVGLVVLLAVGWLVFDHYHYSAPTMAESEIKKLAEKELRGEAPRLLKMGDPYTKRTVRAVEILEVRKLEGKTYLVFKMDYDIEGPQDQFGMGEYFLGLRLVEQKWGGIALKGGMEFESSYVWGIRPVECGYLPEQVFYGFCKDPRVQRGILELGEGKKLDLAVDNRVILASVPPGNHNLTPHFYDEAGNELELETGGLQVAYISEDETVLAPYTNVPMQWWSLGAEDVDYLNADRVDAAWVFSDQQKQALEGPPLNKLTELVEQGVPVLFVGMKDEQVVAQAFQITGESQSGKAGDIEAVYVSKDEKGKLCTGVVTLEDGQGSPLVEKSVELRYQMELASGENQNQETKAAVPTTPQETRPGAERRPG
jgi:hypothetical protein